MAYNFREITIDDKNIFCNYLRDSDTKVSEMTFTNFFMWRNAYGFKFSQISVMLSVISVPSEGQPFAFAPIGKLNDDDFCSFVEQIRNYFKQNNWKLLFKRVPVGILEYFTRLFPNEVEVITNRDDSDYIYSANDLIGLKGKRFDGKRNHINKFKKLYEYSYEKIDLTHIDDCKKIMDEWCNQRRCDFHGHDYCENKANNELLDNYSLLNCQGAMIKVNGKYEAFTIGEMLNENTAVIHIEKANNKIDGLYTFINQQFCENEWGDVEFINREQDLGIEGIRKAKLSYHPVNIVDKYSIMFKA